MEMGEKYSKVQMRLLTVKLIFPAAPGNKDRWLTQKKTQILRIIRKN